MANTIALVDADTLLLEDFDTLILTLATAVLPACVSLTVAPIGAVTLAVTAPYACTLAVEEC